MVILSIANVSGICFDIGMAVRSHIYFIPTRHETPGCLLLQVAHYQLIPVEDCW